MISAFCVSHQAGNGQVLAYTTHAETTVPMPIGASSVMVWATTAAYFTWGSAPVATNTGFAIPANFPVVIRFQPGENQGNILFSALQETSGGNLHIVPLAEPH